MPPENYRLTLWIEKHKLFNQVLDYLLEKFNLLSKDRRNKIYLQELVQVFKAPKTLLLEILIELHNAGQIVLSYSHKQKDHVIFSIEYYKKKHKRKTYLINTP